MSGTGSGRKPKASGPSRSAGGDTGGEGSADDTLVLIAAAAAELARLAQHHKFDVLDHLLAMVRLEADQQLQQRSRRRLS